MPIYCCDRLFSKMHYPSSHAKGDLTTDIFNTASSNGSPPIFKLPLDSREFGVDLLVSIRESEQLRNLESSP
jgi:hypothetical protein